MAPFVALAGFMGSGKSSVGAAVGHLLGVPFVDLDEEVVRRVGMPIADYFARHGEAEFRARELEALKAVIGEKRPDGSDAAAGPGLVLSLGGGTLETGEAATLLESLGGVVLLDIDAESAWERARGEARPLAQDPAAFKALLASRRPTYERVAEWVVPVAGRGVEELAAEIASAVEASGGSWPRSWGMRLTGTERPSTIAGGPGSLDVLRPRARAVAARGGRIFTITDTNVSVAWGERVRELIGAAGSSGHLVLPAGEETKNASMLARCWEWLAAEGARRDDVVLALGGGVVGDLAGFAAATYQRGIGLWQVPTSLLAQVDSSVGGKTAIDLSAGKNLAGAFYQPGLVVIDPDTLGTLPEREYVNGLGEVVKYGLLSGEALFGCLENGRGRIGERDPAELSRLIRRCVRYKALVVAEDERDTGRRAVLNLGHTAAHALEVTLGFGRLGHGEAVALGLLVALVVSERALGLDPGVRRRTESLLEALDLPTKVGLPPIETLEAAAAKDKKVVAGSEGFVGLRAVGDPVWKMALPDGLFAEALEVIRE